MSERGLLSHRFQQCRNLGTIGRSGADVMDVYDTVGINEYVASQLMHVAARQLQSTTPPEQFQITPNGSWAVDVPDSSPFHSIRFVKGSLVVDQ